MKKKALIIIDVQEGIVDFKPYNFTETLANIQTLLAHARKNNFEVIWVQHEADDLALFQGNPKFEVYYELKPETNEKRVTKQHNSIFKDTDLDAYLKGKNIDTLILCGMQTEWCIDKSITVGFELGYHLIVPHQSHTTMDMDLMTAKDLYKYYHYFVFPAFARTISVEETLKIV